MLAFGLRVPGRDIGFKVKESEKPPNAQIDQRRSILRPQRVETGSEPRQTS